MFHHGVAPCAITQAQTIDDKQAAASHRCRKQCGLDKSNFQFDKGERLMVESGWLIDVKNAQTAPSHQLSTHFMILCADDYGLSGDIDRAILELCGLGRLSAVSCLVALERCGVDALPRLLEHQTNVDLGLHLCLADETLPAPTFATAAKSPPHFPAYGAYLRRALLGRVGARESFLQVSAQYQLFLQKCGRRPDFIDGHLHIHQLPGVKEGLIEFVLTLPPDNRPYIRNTSEPLRNIWKRRLPWLKAAFIGAFGGRMLSRLRAAGLPTNDGFAGIYDFRQWRRYPEYFPRFVSCLSNRNGILVVHPGKQEDWRRQ